MSARNTRHALDERSKQLPLQHREQRKLLLRIQTWELLLTLIGSVCFVLGSVLYRPLYSTTCDACEHAAAALSENEEFALLGMSLRGNRAKKRLGDKRQRLQSDSMDFQRRLGLRTESGADAYTDA